MDTETSRPMHITRDGELLTVELGDRLGMENRHLLKEAVAGALDGGVRRVCVRFPHAHPATFVESSGWGVLVSLTRRARECGARLELSCVDPANLGYLRQIRLDEFFQFADEPGQVRECVSA